jgi:hypothetical protein
MAMKRMMALPLVVVVVVVVVLMVATIRMLDLTDLSCQAHHPNVEIQVIWAWQHNYQE